MQTGVAKCFDHGLADLAFDRLIKSSNGEDFLYLFYHAESGTYLQLRYNLISQEVDTPLVWSGAMNAKSFLALDVDGRIARVRETMQSRYQEGYAMWFWR